MSFLAHDLKLWAFKSNYALRLAITHSEEHTSMTPTPVQKKRKDHEPPSVVAQQGWRYHHLGIPTTTAKPGERYLKHLKIRVSGFETSPYGIEWMRFESDCPVSELVQTIPHVAFEVDDLDSALVGKEIIGPPGSPSGGVRAAMIVHNGAPVELIEFRGKKTHPACVLKRTPAGRRRERRGRRGV